MADKKALPFKADARLVTGTWVQPGDLFTVSANKRVRDRSWTTEVWKCLAINEHQIVASRFPKPREYDPILLVIREHDFFDASSFAEHLAGKDE